MINILFITYFFIPFFTCYEATNFNSSKVKFADGKTIPECIIGLSKSLNKSDQTTSEKIRAEGYPVEEHVTLTEDGYLLTLFRIPGRKGARAVLINHGILGSSFDWVVTGRKTGLSFLLADKNYDVWLGNLRGSTYSRCHTKYKTSDKRFWNFSFAEMGKYDLPAQIEYIANVKKNSIVYVGVSMGTTVSYVFATERSDVASKLKAIFSLAPVAFLSHVKSPLRLLTPFNSIITKIVNFLNHGEVLSNTVLIRLFRRFIYGLFFIETKITAPFMFSKSVSDESQSDCDIASAIFDHYPASGSIKTYDHFAQIMISGKFRDYDYGPMNNLKVYNSNEPPDFDVTKIQIPVGLFWANNDDTATPKDVKHLADLLSNKIINYEVPDPKFNHEDFQFNKKAPQLVYSKLISEMENYR